MTHPTPQLRVRAVALSLCVLLAPSAHALNKCTAVDGKVTFQEQPCAATARTESVAGIPPNSTAARRAPPPAQLTAGAALCREAAPGMANLMDPYSAKVDRVGRPQAAVVEVGRQSIEAKRFDVYINSKNRLGAYTGARPYACYLSIDERRVLHVEALPY